MRSSCEAVSVLPAADHHRINRFLGRDKAAVWLSGGASVLYQHVLCRLSGRSHFPRVVIQGLGKGQSEDCHYCFFADLRSRSYRESSAVQIVFAVLVGFVLVLLFYHGKSLISCILFHSANNALKVFSAEGNLNPQAEMLLNLVLIAVVLGGYSLYLVRAFSKNAE